MPEMASAIAARAAGSGPNGASFEASFTTSSMPCSAATTSADRPGTYAGMPSSAGRVRIIGCGSSDDTRGHEELHHRRRAVVRRDLRRRQHEAGSRGLFVGVVDAGEAREQDGELLGVEPLRVAAFADVERAVDEHLEERES